MNRLYRKKEREKLLEDVAKWMISRLKNGCDMFKVMIYDLGIETGEDFKKKTKEEEERVKSEGDRTRRERTKATNKRLSKDAPTKRRETMTFGRKGKVTDDHLKVFFNTVVQDEWIDGDEKSFRALFSGKREEDCILTWTGKHGKGTLVGLFKELVDAELVTVPKGYTIPSILEGHFQDSEGRWLTGLDKGNKARSKALTTIKGYKDILESDLRHLLDHYISQNEEEEGIENEISEEFNELSDGFDSYDHQDLNIYYTH